MKDIEILTFEKLSERSFRATGRIENREFEAKTIIYKGNPIFKIFEDGIVKPAADSIFTVGEKMSVARILKKYSQGKVDKQGRPSDDQKSTGIGLVIQLQNKIDDLLFENKRLKDLLDMHGIDISLDIDKKEDFE